MDNLLIYCLLGLAVGYIGGFAGIGGAPFMVSFLVLVLGFTQLSAQGNVLTVMLGPMSLLGVMTMKKYIMPQLRSIGLAVICYCIFSYFGAELAFALGETDVKGFFAILLFIIALIQLFPALKALIGLKPNNKAVVTKIPDFWVLVIGSIIGLVGGLFGIGAGVLMVPIFISFFNMDKNYARALSLSILLPPVSLGAFLRYNAENLIQWDLVAILFICYFASNFFGARLGTKVSTENFKKAYALLLIIIGITYFII